MKKIHILYYEMGYPCIHYSGGAGTYVQIISKELINRGHKVTVISRRCRNCPRKYNEDGIIVIRIKAGLLHWRFARITGLNGFALSLRYLESGYRLRKTIKAIHKRHPIDIIEFSEGGNFWHKFNNIIPYISHLHGSRYTVLKQSGRPVKKSDWYHRNLELSFIKKATHVVSPSRALLEIVQNEMDEKFQNSSIIPLPLDANLENSYQENKNYKSNIKKIFFAARNDPVKGGQLLLDAIPLVLNKVPNIEFHFYGFKAKAQKSISQNVIFNEFIQKDQLLEKLKDADLCVIPSFWDNSPNTVYEAMAAGKAVVASDVGGITELVQDGETGILFECGKYQDLAEALIRILSSDTKLKIMGQNGRRRILELSSLNDNVDKRLSLYMKILEKFWTEKN